MRLFLSVCEYIRLFGDKSKSAFLRVGFGRRAFYFTGTVAPRKVTRKAKTFTLLI